MLVIVASYIAHYLLEVALPSLPGLLLRSARGIQGGLAAQRGAKMIDGCRTSAVLAFRPDGTAYPQPCPTTRIDRLSALRPLRATRSYIARSLGRTSAERRKRLATYRTSLSAACGRGAWSRGPVDRLSHSAGDRAWRPRGPDRVVAPAVVLEKASAPAALLLRITPDRSRHETYIACWRLASRRSPPVFRASPTSAQSRFRNSWGPETLGGPKCARGLPDTVARVVGPALSRSGAMRVVVEKQAGLNGVCRRNNLSNHGARRLHAAGHRLATMFSVTPWYLQEPAVRIPSRTSPSSPHRRARTRFLAVPLRSRRRTLRRFR